MEIPLRPSFLATAGACPIGGCCGGSIINASLQIAAASYGKCQRIMSDATFAPASLKPENPRSVGTLFEAHAQRRQASWSRSGLDRCEHGTHSSFGSLCLELEEVASCSVGHCNSEPTILPFLPSRLLFRHLPHDVRTSASFLLRPPSVPQPT